MADQKVLTFHSNAVSDDTLLVTGLEGSEGISRLYRYDISLVSHQGTLDLDALLAQTAYFGLKRGIQLGGGMGTGKITLKTHGMLAEVGQQEKRGDWARYRVTLVPRLWKLTRTLQSRIFLDKSVTDIVGEVLKGNGLTANDYEFRTVNTYVQRSYVVQYQETDLAFISRWLEREGIFYFFEQGEEGEKVIFADSSSAYAPIQGGTTLSYKPGAQADAKADAVSSSDDWFAEETVQRLDCLLKPVPEKVEHNDYNWRKPSEDLHVSHQVSATGVGTWYELHCHYRTADEGNQLAKARADYFTSEQKRFHGTSDCRAFRAGATVSVSDHYRYDFNGSYLICEVRHRATQDVELASSGTIGASYTNDFVSMPSDRTFRAPTTTPWPRVAGLLHATIDAAGDGTYAEVDDKGRYKVKLPFDRSGRSGGKASYYVRMASPYAGSDHGMHFPLHKGAEVLLVHIDGDPDRPVIVGSVPNGENPNQVTSDNQTMSKITTAGGNQIHIEDSDGKQRIKFHSPGGKTTFQIGSGLE